MYTFSIVLDDEIVLDRKGLRDSTLDVYINDLVVLFIRLFLLDNKKDRHSVLLILSSATRPIMQINAVKSSQSRT